MANEQLSEGMSVAQAARAIGTRLENIYRLLYAGKLKGRKLDGKWLIERASVASYMENRHNGQRR